MSRFSELKGSLTKHEFRVIMNKTRLKGKTRSKLEQYLVDGLPYNQIPGCTRQFIYKKLVELEDAELINLHD
jgi:hypothetical protein